VALRALALIDTETAGRRPAGAMPAPAPIPLRVRRRPSRLVWGLAAAAALLAVAGAMSWMNAQRATRELAAARAENARLAARLEDERRWAQALASPAARTVSLAATPAAAGLAGPPTARVTYDPVSRRAIVVVANFVAPAGKDFELWAITKAGPASLGLVRAAPSGEAVLRLENVGDPATLGAFAVSLEEKGGAPTPHAPAGPVVMVGKLSG
jgi:anti-sigma-K factor RskA